MLIGYDRRFLSDRAAEAAAEVFAGNNIPTILLSEDAPTPLITYATEVRQRGVRAGLHRQPQPARVERPQGLPRRRLAAADRRDEPGRGRDQRLTADDVVKIPLDIALEAGIVERRDFTNEYVDRSSRSSTWTPSARPGCKVIVDPMYGVGQLTLGIILTEARCRVTFIHERHNPLFGGRSPAPDLEALRLLRTIVREEHYDLGLATDGDADRIAIVDERGDYIPINDLLLLLYWYLHEVRGQTRRRGAQPGDHAPARPAGAPRSARSASRCRSASSTSPAGMVAARCPAGRRVQRRPDHSRPHPGQGRHLRLRADRRDAGAHRQAHLRAAGDRLRHHRPALLGRRQPARHRRDAHRRPAARQGDDRRRGGALSGRQGHRLRRHQGLPRATTTGCCCASPAPSRCCASSPRPTRPRRRARWWIG